MAKPKKRKTKGKKPKGKAKKTKTSPKKRKRKKRKPKKRKPVFEARIEEEVPPEGFTINLGDVTQDEAYAVILARFEDARARLPPGLSGSINVVPMADGSVDGELYVEIPAEVVLPGLVEPIEPYISPDIVPEGTFEGNATAATEWNLYEAFTNLAVGRNYWISTGARYIVETDDERYKRNKGMTQVQTNYQRAIRANIAEEHLILQQTIFAGMQHKFGQEAHSVFIRLHWNPQNAQPQR